MLFALLTLIGCSAGHAIPVSPGSPLPQKRTPKVIALSPHITEILYDLGLESHILAVAEGSDYPKNAQQRPTIRAHGPINVEALLMFKPDWVIAWPYGQAATLKQRLRPFGIRVLFSDPRNFEQLGQDYLAIAALFLNQPQIQARARWRHTWMQQQLERLRTQYRGKPDTPPIAVFILINGSPLRTLNNQHPIVELIETCGGYNVLGDAIAAAPLVSLEALLRTSPQLIILSKNRQQGAQRFQIARHLLEVPAVKHGHLVEVHPDFLHRPSVRALETADVLCQAIAASRRALTDD